VYIEALEALRRAVENSPRNAIRYSSDAAMVDRNLNTGGGVGLGLAIAYRARL
jgi:hypothetical protein